jgi:hypothetical protein
MCSGAAPQVLASLRNCVRAPAPGWVDEQGRRPARHRLAARLGLARAGALPMTDNNQKTLPRALIAPC